MPDPNEPVNPPVVPATPVQSPPVPLNKEGWDQLRKDDPQRWGDLTQQRMDQTFREGKEAKERLASLEAREKNLQAELDRYRQPQLPADQVHEQYGPGRYPQTPEDWDTLFLERPTFANDLRNVFLGEQKRTYDDFTTVRNNSAKTVQSEHPDMYLTETDFEGKTILKIDPVTKFPIFNANSDKGKIWMDIWNEDPKGWTALKHAPSLMMAEMERRLRQRGAAMVNLGQNNSVNDDSAGVAPRGVPPPMTSSTKFASAEEKALAERAVSRGTYKSLEEYCTWRDSGTKSFAEQNSRPDFNKK